MMATIDTVWSASATRRPATIEAALRKLLSEHPPRELRLRAGARAQPRRASSTREYSGEIANRLRRVGRYHPSRTIVCSVEPAPHDARRGRDDRRALRGARAATSACCARPSSSRSASATCAHLDRSSTRSSSPTCSTCVWSPHGHHEAVDALLDLAQVVLLDSVDEPEPEDGARRAPRAVATRAYVVDLAWLRSTPWRERIAATFDPDHAAARPAHDLGA